MTDVGWLFAALTSAVAACGMARLVAAARAQRPWHAEIPHVAMGLGMAVMFAPTGPSLPRPWAALVFAGIGVWCLTRLLRRYPQEAGYGRHAHSVTGCLAMAYTLSLPATAMPHMTGTAPASAAVSLALALYFVIEAAWSGLRMATITDTGGGILLVTPQIGLACHMTTGIAMGYMFLTIR